MTLLTAPAALLLAIFGENVLLAWSGDANLARKAGPLVSLLAIGSFLNGLMYVPYQLQLAHGWTGLTVKVNLTAVLILVPALFWAVGAHGALGAAWIWTILNAGYVLFAIQLMHLRLMPEEKWDWYLRDVTWPTLAAAATLLLFRVFRPLGMVDRLGWFRVPCRCSRHGDGGGGTNQRRGPCARLRFAVRILLERMSSPKLLVTIGIPTYNREGLVGRAIESALAQDYPDIEIVISDNCSSDGTSRICEQFAARYPQIRYVHQATNLGATRNFQSVLDLAAGSYFMWLGDDDHIDPNYVSATLQRLQHDPGAALVSGLAHDDRGDRLIFTGRKFTISGGAWWG